MTRPKLLLPMFAWLVAYGCSSVGEPRDAGASPATEEVLAVDEALQRLAALDARQARIVELRYFAGLSIEQTAESLEISPATVKRDWLSAKAWLQRELSGP